MNGRGAEGVELAGGFPGEVPAHGKTGKREPAFGMACAEEGGVEGGNAFDGGGGLAVGERIEGFQRDQRAAGGGERAEVAEDDAAVVPGREEVGGEATFAGIEREGADDGREGFFDGEACAEGDEGGGFHEEAERGAATGDEGDFSHEFHGGEGVAADGEEVVGGAQVGAGEDFFPGGEERVVGAGGLVGEEGLRGGRDVFGKKHGEPAAVEFAGGGKREGGDRDDDIGQHPRGQGGGQVFSPVSERDVGRGGFDEEEQGDKAVGAGGVGGEEEDGGVGDGGVGEEGGFDFAGFDAVAVEFDLVVFASEVEEAAVGEEPAKVAGGVKGYAGGGQAVAGEVAKIMPVAGADEFAFDDNLAGFAGGHRAALVVHEDEGFAADRMADADLGRERGGGGQEELRDGARFRGGEGVLKQAGRGEAAFKKGEVGQGKRFGAERKQAEGGVAGVDPRSGHESPECRYAHGRD